LRFDPITLFLRSSCMSDTEVPISVSTDVWTEEIGDKKYIVFTPPCPAIRWADRYSEHKQLVFNRFILEEQQSLVEVSIFNEDYANRKLFDQSVDNESPASGNEKRLERIVLLYRRYGYWNESSWQVGNLVDGSNSADFSSEGVEDGLGYASLKWNLDGIKDSRYEVKVQSQCKPLHTPQTELNFYNTRVVEVVLDSIPPAIYGVPQVKLTGPIDSIEQNEYTISFTETLYCEMPYVFKLTLTLEDRIFSHSSGLYVKCIGEVIKYRFDEDELQNHALQYFSQANEIPVIVQLEGVEDLAHNQMNTYTFDFTWELEPGKRTPPAAMTPTITGVLPELTRTILESYTIQGLVWEDSNRNGLYDQSEPVIESAKVNLRRCDSVWVKTISTDDVGQFMFIGVDDGDYLLEFVKPSLNERYVFTTPNMGNSPSDVDSSVVELDITTGKTKCFLASTTNKGMNAGFV